ncbi:MAG: T9SS type A sorting domain-containing protein, partial [Bacteroidetes bacterium]|nr:T9SS type A sorting domain-containing protein [Bacteroidota bacterium]
WRYNSLYNCLQENEGILSWDEGMDALEAVHMNCPWSAIYELNNRAIYVAINNNYDDIAYTDLENFDFTIYVGVPDQETTNSGNSTLKSFPNPFMDQTQIRFNLSVTEHIMLTVFDRSGRQVATLADEVFTDGEHSISWDGRDSSGNLLPSGIYLCSLKSGNNNQTIQVILNTR